jgi:hypothetical protein
MRWSDLPLNPTTTMLRTFALVAAALSAALAAVQLLVYQNALAAALLAALAIVAVAMALLAPWAIRPVFVGILIVTFPVSWLVMQLLLALVYYGLFTPVALWFKLIGRDALRLRVERDRASYWTAKPVTDDVRRYFRQS